MSNQMLNEVQNENYKLVFLGSQENLQLKITKKLKSKNMTAEKMQKLDKYYNLMTEKQQTKFDKIMEMDYYKCEKCKKIFYTRMITDVVCRLCDDQVDYISRYICHYGVMAMLPIKNQLCSASKY